MFMILDGHWQCVCVCVCACVWFIIMILVVWITACFLFWPAPTPSGFNLSMTTVCMCVCVWFSNHDTCCLNYSMFFCSDLPPPLQVSILAWKLNPRKWKETCWKTIPKLKSKKQLHCFTQNETIIFKNQTITIKEQRFYIYIYVYTHIYIYIHTYIRTYIHTYMHTHIHTYIR